MSEPREYSLWFADYGPKQANGDIVKPRYGLYRRDANEPEIIGTLVSLGCHVEPLHWPTDLLVAYRDANESWRQALVEIKLPEGPRGGLKDRTLTGAQATFFERWPESLRYVVRSADEATQLLEILRLA